MTKTLIATAAILFATSVHAADSRQQFIGGNPDSDNSRGFYSGVTAVQPAVGSNIDRYQGIADDNPDLFNVELGPSPRNQLPETYGSIGANPDLNY